MWGVDSPLPSNSEELGLEFRFARRDLGQRNFGYRRRLCGVDDTVVTDVERRLMGRVRIENAVGTGLGGLRAARRRGTGSRRPGLG